MIPDIEADDGSWHPLDSIVEVPESDDGRNGGRCYYHWRQPVEGQTDDKVYFETVGEVPISALRPPPSDPPGEDCNGRTSDGDLCQLPAWWGRSEHKPTEIAYNDGGYGEQEWPADFNVYNFGGYGEGEFKAVA